MFGRFGLLEPYVSCHKVVDEDQQNKKGALWLGDYQAALDKVGLKLKSIRTVISVVSGIDLHYDKDPSIHHKIYYIHDSPDQDIQKIFDETFLEIENGLSIGSVLVHCVMGISRSASTVIAYLMKKYNYGFSYAYNFVKKKRAIICPNYGFCRQLKEYEKKIRKEQDVLNQQQANQHGLLVFGQSQLKSSQITLKSFDSNGDLCNSLKEQKYKHPYQIKQKKLNLSYRDNPKDQAKLNVRNVSLDLRKQDIEDISRLADQEKSEEQHRIRNRNQKFIAIQGLQNSKQISSMFPQLNNQQYKKQQDLIVLGNKQLNF